MEKQLFLRRQELSAFTGLSYTTIFRLERLGKFPKRRRLSQTAVGWLRTEVEAWANMQAAVEPPQGEKQ